MDGGEGWGQLVPGGSQLSVVGAHGGRCAAAVQQTIEESRSEAHVVSGHRGCASLMLTSSHWRWACFDWSVTLEEEDGAIDLDGWPRAGFDWLVILE